MTWGAVEAVSGAITDTIIGAVVGSEADDIINAIENDFGLETYEKRNQIDEKMAKAKFLAKKKILEASKSDWW